MDTCLVNGCTRPATKRGRCHRCYNRWYKSPDFVPKPPPPPYVPKPDPVCPWCGPYKAKPGCGGYAGCPTCGLDAAEVRYAERILADSAAVYRQEWAEFEAERRRGAA